MPGIVGRLDSMVAERVAPKDWMSAKSATGMRFMRSGVLRVWMIGWSVLISKDPRTDGMEKSCSAAEYQTKTHGMLTVHPLFTCTADGDEVAMVDEDLIGWEE